MTEQELIQVFEQAGVGWVFAQVAHDETELSARAAQYLSEMREVDQLFAERFPGSNNEPLATEIPRDIQHFKPLVQAFASPMTTPIRTMIYSVLDGAQVQSIEFEYRFKAAAMLKVVVEYDSGERAAFASEDVWDAEALRHFGIMKMGGAPIIDGYYAFRDQD